MSPFPVALVTVDEAARQMRVTPTTIRRWIKSGRICAYKPGKYLLIPVTEITGLLGGAS